MRIPFTQRKSRVERVMGAATAAVVAARAALRRHM
jgi:hypothetical protein